jgi:hypothetical protein
MKVRKKNKTQEINKFICTVKKRQHRNPLFGHIGDEISKNKKKTTLGFNGALNSV